MSLRETMNIVLLPAVAASAVCALPGIAAAQTSFVAPDGRNRFPAVTIFCPSGNGVAPCSFGGGVGAGGAVSINLGGTAVSAGNRFPMSDAALDALINGGALSVALNTLPPVGLAAGTNAIGSVSVSNLPVNQAVSGTVGISSLPPLPSGGNTIGNVSVSNLPATQAISAAALPLPAGAASDASVVALKAALGTLMQQSGGTVAVSGLPPLAAGSNAIGSVSVSNLPATQAISAASLPLPAGAALDASVVALKTALGSPMQQTGGAVAVSSLPALAAGGNAIGSVSISGMPSIVGTVGVSALPALPAGANTIGAVTIAGTPNFTCTGCGGGGSGGGSVIQGAGAVANPWWIQGLGSAGTAAGGVVTVQGAGGGVALPVSGNFWQAVQPVSGTVSMTALPAGSNTIGSVSVSNLPATQAISAASLPLPAGAALDASVVAVKTALGTPMQQSGGSVAVSSLPVLPAGSNAIGSVSVSNLPATQAVSAASLPLPAGAALDASVVAVKSALGTPMQQSGGSVSVSSLPALPAGSNAIGIVSVSNLPATQAISAASLPLPAGAASDASVQSVKTAIGTPMQQTGGSVSVTNLPATQPVSATTLPLPTGAATVAAQIAPFAPVAPAAATATTTVLIGCLANTSLPSFNAGQQGAIPCDTSGRPYVVSVPSANNVPSFLQAVTSGGATVYRAINAASSTMTASIKSASGMVYGYEACNSGTAAAYLRLFALGVAPSVGTSTPLVSKLLPVGACQTMTTSIGLVFGSGIGVDVTGGSMADSDTGAVGTAATVSLSVYYK